MSPKLSEYTNENMMVAHEEMKCGIFEIENNTAFSPPGIRIS
jgi:hypothetical protein